MTESITLLEDNNLKTEKNSLSIQFKPESYDTEEMESMTEEDKPDETTDHLKSGKRVKASDQTCREATNQKTGEVSTGKFGACTGQTGQTGNSINTSSKTAVKNKNATLRKSKSCLQMTTSKREAVKHSMSFCGNSNNSSNYSSIPESHGDNADPEQQVSQQQSYQKKLPLKQQSQQLRNDQKQTEKQGEFQTNMQTFKTSSTTAVILNDSAITSTKTAVTSTDSAIKSTKTAVTSTDSAITSTKTAVTSTDSAITSTKTAVTSTDNVIALATKSVISRENVIISTTTVTMIRDNVITSTTTAVIPRDNVITSTTAAVTPRNNAITSTTKAVTPRDNVKKSTTVVSPRDNVVTSTTTAITQRINVITSTAIAGTSITAVTSHQQPLTLNLKQVSPADSKGSSQVCSPFSPPSVITSNYSNWLSQKWQGTDVEQFHGDSDPEGQLKADKRKSNISVDRLSYDAPPEEKVLTSSRGTEAYNSAHKPWSSKKSNFTTAPPGRAESASTVDCKYSKQQPTSLNFTMNDLGSKREAPTSIEMSVIQNSSLSSQSQDYVSIPILSSMESSTLLSQSFVSSMESSASSLSLTETTQTSVPTAVISPTCTGTFLKREKRKDFILLYSDADQDEAERYRDHLQNDIDIPDISVDLFGDIDSGKSAMTSLETLHDRYNNILVLGTMNSANDKFSRFLTENILTTGLKEANGKEDRVIPVWACSDCKNLISELKIIKGFEYFFFLSDSTSRRANSYIKCVRSTVKNGRKNSDKF